MGDILSPSPSSVQKQRRVMASQIQSPTSPFFLGSNDDKLERAQARAARAAAVRRKNTAVTGPPPRDELQPYLGKQQILDLFHNCIKLASENKINQKNTWELKLIDHLTEIIKAEEDDTETNFQKASCTLEAGVKIYSLRVDSVHSEAYKVLGGMNRAGQENDQEAIMPDDSLENEKTAQSKKDFDRKLSPLSTLESSFEALNVKKFDVAFAVDPLYHQTSAQFDEGGAKGLLMNNLGIYDGCRVLFDSEEIPGKPRFVEERHDNSDIIDLSFARECIETTLFDIQRTDEISPTLRHIVSLFDEENRRPPNCHFSKQKSTEEFQMSSVDDSQFDGEARNNGDAQNYDHDEQASVVDDGPYDADSGFPSYNEENETFAFHDPDLDDRFERVDEYLFLSLGLPSKRNAWAGPDHWKFKKSKGSEIDPSTEKESQMATKKHKRKQAESDINFTKSLEIETPDLFAPPRNPKSLLFPKNRLPCNTRLPEDCHYQPEDLVKLFLLPNVKCIGSRRRKFSDESRQHYDDHEPSWGDDHGFGGEFDDGSTHSDVEDSSTLVTQPRQVKKIEVQYDKTSKQVDVQALKETLWDCMHESLITSEGKDESLSFKQILATFPPNCKATEGVSDISPHLYFICLLHLANEHGLSIKGSADLDDLSIHLPH